jgi:hypothetical protein
MVNAGRALAKRWASGCPRAVARETMTAIAVVPHLLCSIYRAISLITCVRLSPAIFSM